jgi:hypothetical protein
MIPEYKKKANIGVGVGLLLIVLAIVIGVSSLNSSGGMSPTALMLMLGARIAGAVIFIWGCCMYAKGKGYSAALGLLGLLFLVGLIVLAVLPDKCKEQQARGFAVVPPRR